MKNAWIVIFVTLLVLFGAPRFVDAHQHDVDTAVLGTTADTTPSQATNSAGNIEYALPYPGILPTHPLYFLKSIRDRIIEALIVDPVNKAEFYVLQADKKLAMAISFDNQGKEKESKDTLADSINSRKQAIASLESAQKIKKQIPGYVVEKLSQSLRKHKEVLVAMEENIGEIEILIGSATLLRPQAN